jgi:signal transduction histidine kinase
MSESTKICLSDADYARLKQLAALGEVAAGVVHETRNLMTVIVGFAQLARRKPESSRYAELIEQESLRVSELLDHFLRIARTDADEAPSVDASAAIHQVTAALEPQLVLKRIGIDVTVDRNLPAVGIRANELHQVLLNLLVNAMYATPPRGRITVGARAVDDKVEIEVTDTGTGVPANLRERIFEPFFTTKAVGSGTGLGLALCRRVIEAAGGAVTCEEARAGGACFRVRLPTRSA